MMKKQAFNPYLPSYEYIPDGEPYVFGERLYVYGSHDKFNSEAFCLNNYVCWSAPIDDLGNWQFEGQIYDRLQDPLNIKGNQYTYAPDVQQGPDGKFYLFYALNRSSVISVAVCDKPVGDFKFYGHIKFPDGHNWGSKIGEVNNFDPGVFIDEDKKVYLYSGFAPNGWMEDMMKARKLKLDGAYCVELESDMLTIKGEPTRIAPGHRIARGTSFEGHAFYEANSMRKIKDKYYFIYSSQLGHELCYAVSDNPKGPFIFGGTIISIADLGFENNETALNYLGNTHGSILEIKGQLYVFYHRQTNGHEYSRQGCADPVKILPDGRLMQVEMTSCGLNGGPLNGNGQYEARIACNLSSAEGAVNINLSKKENHPYFTQSGSDREENGDQYIANLTKGSWAGYKYFMFDSESEIDVTVRGKGSGFFVVTSERNSNPIAKIEINPTEKWSSFSAPFSVEKGKRALYFTFEGLGAIDFQSFTIR